MGTSQIAAAYRFISSVSGFYNDFVTGTGIMGKYLCRLIWKLKTSDCTYYRNSILDNVPDGFDGALLDVPVGTGVLTAEKYVKLTAADITCLDYSETMMVKAKLRYGEKNIRNIHFVQGDVGCLPFEDESFDIVISMNGFHAFPDKDAAFSQIYRILKKKGILTGCFYIKDEVKRSDWFVKHLMIPAGYFTPPFLDKGELDAKLRSMYGNVMIWFVGAFACFRCVK